MISADDKKSEQQYIQDVLNNDIELSKSLNKLSKSTLDKLRIALADLLEDDLGNSIGTIPVYFLDKLPGKKQAEIINRLYEDIEADKDMMGSHEVQLGLDTSLNSYKSSNSAAITVAVFLVLLGHMKDSNRIMQKSGKSDREMAISHLIDKGGQFDGNKLIAGIAPDFAKTADANGNTVSEINYNATVNASNGIANAVKGKIRTGVNRDDMAVFLNSGNVQPAIVSKDDKVTRDYKVKNENNPTGWLSRLDSDNIRTYRTMTALAHSLYKKEIAKALKIKQATIINETDPCKFCVENIGRIFTVDEATSRVPSHYNCRCEVRLVNEYGEITDDDPDDE
ncbi:MAG: hypothetical protein [Caudoviricetes sp.]|nr:MAG: hypothetical protein [Caudoviricetes sp.]